LASSYNKHGRKKKLEKNEPTKTTSNSLNSRP
jgi:hypothetical protein